MLVKSVLSVFACVGLSTQSVLPTTANSLQARQTSDFGKVCDKLKVVEQKSEDCRKKIVDGQADLSASVEVLAQLKAEYSASLQQVTTVCVKSPCQATPAQITQYKTSLASCLKSLSSVTSYLSVKFSASYEEKTKG
ncbi:hypothetical protein DFH28DRAFT_968333 [Melampsora americana]|nr:hypothetical protein DFH28DRAFT_968333 [Melampsora americana]